MTVIETPRLILRRVTLDDLPKIEAMYVDPAGMQFKGGPRTRETIRNMVEGTIRFYEGHDYGRWGVILKAEERFIGWCGLLHHEVEGEHEVEVSYHLDRAYWGSGLATEAARAVKEYGFALKNGMHFEKDVTWRNKPRQVYAIVQPEE